MATAHLFSYNLSANGVITGCTQFGNMAVSLNTTDTVGFSVGNMGNPYHGSDEDLGYVIAYASPSGTRTHKRGTELSPNAVGFIRSTAKTDVSFVDLVNKNFNQSFSLDSSGALTAKSYLTTNGYWTSWIPPIISVNTAQIYYDPGNSSSYSGSGTTLTNIGTLGSITGTLGTLSGVAYNSGVSSGVFDFDGVSDKITFGQYNFGNTITVNVWVYPRTEYSINCLISNCAANTSTNGFKMSWNNWNSTNYTLNFEAGNGSSGNTTSTGDNIVVASTWQMITFVFDKTTPSIKFYKNGVEIATASGGSPVANIGMNNTNWWMGSIGGNSYYMNAYMGQFKVWTSLRTISEVLSEYNDSKSRYGL